MEEAVDVAAAAEGDRTEADTIATRTRTKFSLVDVPIDTLEASLPDSVTDQVAVETEEDREYQRFLSSLLPNEQENLSFLDEEDEEYRPEEEEEDHEDDEARRGISKKELTDLLLDSTHMPFPKTPVAGTSLGPDRNEALLSDERGTSAIDAAVPLPLSGDDSSTMKAKKIQASATPAVANLVNGASSTSKPAAFRGRYGTVTQEQCIQLASQMHKHLQLLLQSYHLMASGTPTPALAECRAMINELQQRGEKALRYKNTLLSKLNPGIAGNGESTASEIESAHSGEDKQPPSSEPSTPGKASDSSNSTENFVALRRVTRSLTAAHAAVAHPSMFELVGSQTVYELTAGFARGCSLEERNRSIQEQMLQLDKHLLSAKKHRRTKKGFSLSEDTLLAHGVKRFGAQPDSWEPIRKHFLPHKSTQNLRYRYRYLTSKKTGTNAVKAFHQQTPQLRDTRWLLEEDLRIARGLVELHNERNHFARLAKTYLPHRSRIEIRKRWERMTAKFRAELAEIGLVAPDDNSLDLAVAMKEYLEDKLRSRMLRQKGEAEMAKMDAALQLQQLGQGCYGGIEAASTNHAHKNGSRVDPCKAKNLHPALFFSSWSFISPATLLNSTCEHNWPSFMNEGNDNKHRNYLNSRASMTDSVDITAPTYFDMGETMLGQSQTSERIAPGNAESVNTMHVSEALTEHSSLNKEAIPLGQSFQENTPLDFSTMQNTGDEGDEEDDDSDYEHDELLSSENDGSDSDFEQIELSDNDDDEGSVDAFEHDALLSDSDNQSVASADSMKTPSRSPLSSPPSNCSSSSKVLVPDSKPSPGIHHPLRLQNLGQPGNERMKRALAALERRIIGEAALGTTSLVANSKTPLGFNALNKRAKRKVASTLVAPLGAGHSSSNLLSQPDQCVHKSSDNIPELSVVSFTGDNDGNDGSEDAWGDGSGNDDFEVDELPSSPDELSSDTTNYHERDMLPHIMAAAPENEQVQKSKELPPRRQASALAAGSNALPNKKPKLQQCPSCQHTTCICSSSMRMQLLLRRMKEKRSSSTM